jgi:hypothetical protein
MSDVIAATLITGGIAVVGYITTYLVANRQAATSIAAVERQAEIEMRKAREETERLREQHREAERQNRQGTYHRMIAMMNRLERFATGFPPKNFEEFQKAVDELNFLTAGLDLFGGRDVREANGRVADVFAEIGRHVPPKGSDPAPHEVWTEEYRKRMDAVRAAELHLLRAMRRDIGVPED